MTETLINIPDLAGQMIEHRTRHSKRKMKPSGIRISEIGHPCTRYLVHSVLDWTERASADAGLNLIFQEGNLQEDEIVKDLIAIGAKIWGQQETVSWDEFGLVGHPDGKVYLDEEGEVFAVVEIKSTNSWRFTKLEKPEDFLDESDISRKWYAQLQLYMLLLNTEHGIFLLKDRQWGGLKQINVRLDYEYAETILKKAQEAWKHIQAKTFPDKLNQFEICGKCSFNHTCCPDLIIKPADVLVNDELESLLEARAVNEEAKRSFETADKMIKKMLPNVEGQIQCGKWMITGKKVERKSYVCPATSYLSRSYERIVPMAIQPTTEIHIA